MDKQSPLQSLLNPSDDLKHPNEKILAPFFSVLRCQNDTISPWLCSTFWYNALNLEFRERYFKELFKIIQDYGKKPEHADKRKSIMTTIFHIIFTFHTQYPKELIRSFYDSIFSLNNQEIAYFLMYIEKHNQQLDFSFTFSRLSILDNTISVSFAIPIFTFQGLLHLLRASSNNRTEFLNQIIQIASKPMDGSTTQILNHLIFIILHFFPDLDHAQLQNLNDELLKLLTLPFPISDMISDTLYIMKKSLNSSGCYCFYNHLLYLPQFSEAFSNSVPLFFDATNSAISTFLYNDTIERSSYISSYLDFSRYFIMKHYQSKPPTNVSDLKEIMQNLQFNKKYLQSLPETFKFQELDSNDHLPLLAPPANTFQLVRLPTNFQMTLSMNEPYFKNMLVITSPAETILKQSFFSTLTQYLNTNRSPFEQQIVVIGDDTVLSTLISALAIFIMKNPNAINIEFQIYFIPGKESRFGDFLAENDYIYKMLVRHLLTTTELILPALNENSKTVIPNFVPSENNYENNIWFGIPSPSHVLQFGIQHYLRFAQKKTDLYLWQCMIQQTDQTIVSVPFIGSVSIESNDQKKSFELVYNEFGQKSSTSQNENKSFSLYNVNIEKGSMPNKGFLILDTGTPRMVLSVQVSAPLAKPFTFFIIVDGRKYGPMSMLNILPLTPISNSKQTEPIKMKFKTFVDFS